MIQVVIQIECLHGTKFLDPDSYLDPDPDNFGPIVNWVIETDIHIKSVAQRADSLSSG